MRKLIALSLLFSGLFVVCHAQSAAYNVVDSIAGHFIKSIAKFDKEKVILQTDRKVYAAGEKIWFKAFLVHTLNNRLDTTSKNLFVDLVDDSDRLVKQLVLNAVRLQTDGAITLNDALPTGYYWLRGYTQNILQTDSTGICVQPLYIKNLGGNSVLDFMYRPPVKSTKAPVINFFPEGGSLIAGISSTAAVQVTDGDGNPLVVQGVITIENDSIITGFTTNRLGLARISLYPVWFKKYVAAVTINGQNIKCQLPAWNPFAAQISVTRQTNDYIQAYVTLEDSIYSRKFTSYILGISRDSLCFAGIGRGMYQVDIPTANFPGGVVTLLLFDASQHLLSERKVFIDKDNINIQITTNKKNYTARDKAHVSIDVKDAAGNPLIASLNIAVQDNRLLQVSDEVKSDTIQPLQTYEMEDWLKHNHSFFSAADIDLLMLAQKPGYANWQHFAAPEQADTDKTNLLLNVEGTVVNRRLQPLKHKVVSAISITGANPYLGIDTTNDGGGFQLPLPVNRDNQILKLQVTSKHEISENDSIIINSFAFPHFATPPALKHIFATGKQVFAQKIARYHVDTVFVSSGREWLKPVTVKANIKPKAEIDYDQSKRLSSFSYILSGDKLGHGSFGEISNSMLMVPGMALVSGKLVLYGDGGRGMGASGNVEPIIVIDGVRVPDESIAAMGANLTATSPVLNFLSTLDPRSIDFIEVLNGPSAAIYGNQGGNGVISINTRTRPRELVKDIIPYKIVQPITYHKAPIFAMPDYGDKTLKLSKTPDPRTTIYWNGNLLTGTDGTASVDFYTADDATTYTIIVSGITANGEYISKRITVNRK